MENWCCHRSHKETGLIVRAAKLRVGASCTERAVQHLFPLELSCYRKRDGTDDPTQLRAETPVSRLSRNAAVAANLWLQTWRRETLILKL